ncbi:MAG: RNA-binding protein [Anaplasmataceae bacterium]|nr:RNA-binding protein [Anaplasmataceae bacterium]
MEKKLYVGGLSYDTTEGMLKEAFSQAGTVESAIVIMDRDTNRSKGFGFVEMSSEGEAKKAIEMFNGQEIDGRRVSVTIARPKEDRSGGGFNRSGSGKARFNNSGHRSRNNW